MRILIGHNQYQTAGGEDSVVKSEYALLKDNGQDVHLYKRSNDELSNASFFKKTRLLNEFKYSRQTYRDFTKQLNDFKPDIVHLHNIFYMITPSIYYACRDYGVPVIQSLHNFRLMCINGLFLRDQKVCELCTQKSLWQGLKHRCFKGSFFKSFLMSNLLIDSWKKNVWNDMVSAYIVASDFTKGKYVNAGIQESKIFIKPNFVYPNPQKKKMQNKPFALYVGRLSEEKGVELLLEAWKQIKDIPLVILGTGPLEKYVQSFIMDNHLNHVSSLGYATDEVYEEHMSDAEFLIIPSQCYENFPRIVAESYFYGKPIIASRLGSLQEVVEDYKTGLLFDHTNVNDLVAKIQHLRSSNGLLDALKSNVEKLYQEKFTSKKNYEILMNIYNSVLFNTKGNKVAL